MSFESQPVPIIADVDVLIVGGATAGVAAAVAAAREGASVFLAAAETYLGADPCATLDLWQSDGEPVRPMAIKIAHDEAMLKAGARYLFGLQPSYVLRDSNDRVAGAAFTTRSGTLAVRAKVMIDATPRAVVARMAGVKMKPWQGTSLRVSRVVVGHRAADESDMTVEAMPAPIRTTVKDEPIAFDAWRYTFDVPMADDSIASFEQAEQIARDRTWHRDQVMGADRLSYDWPTVIEGPIAAGLHVLDSGGGAGVGEAAAKEATDVTLGDITLMPRGGDAIAGELRDVLPGERPARDATARVVGNRALPVIDKVDVVVVGGGTGGAPAGIAAARQGAKTLILEGLNALGGVGTLGLICNYYHGYREGFTAEVTEGLAQIAGETEHKGRWLPEHKAEWLRRTAREAGAEVWFGATVGGVVREGDRITGVVVATPYGQGIVTCGAVVDATGNADVPAFAGCPTTYIDAEHVAVQGTGLPPRHAKADYTNTDYDFIEDADLFDVWRGFVNGRQKFRDAFDMAQIVDSRERRQIVGEVTIDPVDIFAGRTYPDSVAVSRSNFDTHGFTIHPMFFVEPPDRQSVDAYVPLRALKPQGIENVFATGLGMSGHRDAMPVLRMQACTQNHAYAAGVAATMLARDGVVDVKALQRMMIGIGNLPPEAATHQDNFPLPDDRLRAAVTSGGALHADLAALMSDPPRGIAMVREALKAATDESLKRRLALILAVMGDDGGAAVLVDALAEAQWDEGWNYTGMGQFGMSFSAVDSLIAAAAAFPGAQSAILNLTKQLDSNHAMSHHRAAAMACERIGDAAAAPVLAEVLGKPGMCGHAFVDMDAVRAAIPESSVDTSLRNVALRELHLARALYRCGDSEGVGRGILEAYAQDMRGHFSRHARAVLGGEFKIQNEE